MIKASLVYYIKGLPLTYAVQKTYVGTKYVYALQRKDKDAWLSRCLIEGRTATYVDHMVLKNFGHGQTLDWYQWNEKDYWLVVCKATDIDKYKWGVQIGRVEYVPDGTINYTEIERLSSCNRARKSAKSLGEIKRLDGGLSPNKKYLFIWVCTKKNKRMFTLYDFDKINEAWDKKIDASSKYVACDLDEIKNANLKSQDNGIVQRVAYGSCQGLAIDNIKNVYLIGGAIGRRTSILKFKYGDGWKTPSTTLVSIGKNFTKHSETEGIQVKGDTIYFSITDKSKKDRYIIYSIEKY